MTDIRETIPAGETIELITERDAKEVYNDPDNKEGFEYEILDGRISMGHTRNGARNGRSYSAGLDGTINPYGGPLYAHNHASTDGRIYIEPAGFLINIYSGQMETGTDIESFTHDPNADGNQLPSGKPEVLRRAEVIVQSPPANAGSIFAGGTGGQQHEIEAGTSFGLAVGSVDTIYVRAPNAGDVANVTYEVR